jgi:ATP-dependent DNA helicase MPH1
MRLPSQAINLGSDDTVGDEDIDDTQAYLLDSDLLSFIARDDEEVDAPPDSSLPSLDFGGLGRGTQAVMKSAQKRKKPRRVEKLFTSDVTEDEAVVSSDSDSEDDVPLRKGVGKGFSKSIPYTVDSASEDEEEDVPIVPARKRVRRVVEEDDDDE